MAFRDIPILSNFTGADENPLSEGGNWQAIPIQSGVALTQRLSNQWAPVGGSQSMWAQAFGAEQSAFVTVVALPSGGGGAGLFMRIDAPNTAGVDCYSVTVTSAGVVAIAKLVNGASYNLGDDMPVGFAAGDKLGMVCRGRTIEAWRFTGGVWVLLGTRYDTDVTLDGFIGAQLVTGATFDDFAAGETVNDPVEVVLPSRMGPF